MLRGDLISQFWGTGRNVCAVTFFTLEAVNRNNTGTRTCGGERGTFWNTVDALSWSLRQHVFCMFMFVC